MIKARQLLWIPSFPTIFNEMISGLTRLLAMDWSDPYTITSNHYVNNQYVPFQQS